MKQEAGNKQRGQRSTRRVRHGSKPEKAPEQKIVIDERMESSHSGGRLRSGAVGGWKAEEAEVVVLERRACQSNHISTASDL